MSHPQIVEPMMLCGLVCYCVVGFGVAASNNSQQIQQQKPATASTFSNSKQQGSKISSLRRLRGDPLPNKCGGKHGRQHQPDEEEEEVESTLEKVMFYIVVMLGFATGFWGVVGSLLYSRTWRHALFRRVEYVTDFLITLGMGLFYYGLRDTTATYATNFLNLIPVVTFIFSLITRLEKLNLKTIRGNVRVIGTIFCLSGAIIISLYRGSLLVAGHESTKDAKIIKPDFKIGTIKLCASILSYALWFIVQVKLLREFPLKYWATMLTCLSASIQGAIVGVILDRSSSAWKLGWNLQLVTIVYSGVLASAASFCIISWAVESKGATFPAMFNPLTLIFVAIIEVSALGQELRSGSLIGMLVIIVGLYAFLWGSGTGKKTELTLPKSSNNEGEAAKSNELARSQMSATVVPTASPISHVSQSDHEQSV
uniref:EamA domain-containing protein n=1 Tax=Chenopodium quinoa TaxID=63459 RepID=A0A803L273_CHEQI